MSASVLVLLACLAVLGAGLLALVRARALSRSRTAFLAVAVAADARVVDLDWQATGQLLETGTNRAFPVVEFRLPQGGTVRARTRTGAFPAPAAAGEVVRVLYDPRDPDQVDLAPLAQQRSASTIMTVLGVAFLGFSLVGLLVWWFLFRVVGIPV